MEQQQQQYYLRGDYHTARATSIGVQRRYRERGEEKVVRKSTCCLKVLSNKSKTSICA